MAAASTRRREEILSMITKTNPLTRTGLVMEGDYSRNEPFPYFSVTDNSVPELTERINKVVSTQLLNLVVLPGICFGFLDLLQRLFDMINRGHSVSAPLASGLNQLIFRDLQ